MLSPDGATHDRSVRATASPVLLSAALTGFLCAAAGCSSSEVGGPPSDAGADYVILSSTVDPNMTLETFTAQCDARAGSVEIHSHCGGMNTCRGMSYDAGTRVLTEHTCRAMNTCAGYSCVVEG